MTSEPVTLRGNLIEGPVKEMLPTQLHDEPDEDLLVYIRLEGHEGRDAWAEVYQRHAGFIFSSLKRSWGSILDESELEDAMQETFLRATRYADSYCAEGNDEDTDLGRRRVRAWLGRIAQNVVSDRIARPWTAHDLFDEQAFAPPQESNEIKVTPILSALTRALSELPERDQDVLRTTMLFWKAGEAHQRLPNNESKALASRWNTTPTTIRAVRSRAMRKLKTRVEQLLSEEAS